MKVQELFEAKGSDVVSSLVRKFNSEESGSEHEDLPIDYKNVGMRVWTRGDGTRYREPGVIFLDRNLTPKATKEWQKKKPVQKFWDWLKTQSGVKPIGKVSGEFGSSEMRDAVTLKDLYFGLTPYNTIEWGSKSRFTNKRSVWRHKGTE